MNRTHILLNHLLAAMLVVALLVIQSAPALAADTESQESAATLTQEGPTDAGEGNDTPIIESPSEGPETVLQTVSTLEELLQTLEQAESGATIGIGCEIVCPAGVVIGVADKPITVKRTAPEGRISIYSPDGEGNSAIQEITFDGNSIEATTPFVQASIATSFLECNFSNCTAGAVVVDNGNTSFSYCDFTDNTAQQGAHIRVNGGSANFYRCLFADGTATIRAGAIACYTDQNITLENCSLFGNTAAQHGGAIWNKGELTISQCRIEYNTANGEPDDIVNEYQGRLALMDDHNALVALYAPYGLTPNKWTVDTFMDDSSDKPNMVFSMTFAANAPEPSPEPEPTPEATSEPTIIYRTHTVEKVIKEPEAEPATITNGKAILKAPEGVFWTGYETGHGGAAEAVRRADLAVLMVSLMDQENRNEWATDRLPFDDVEPGEQYTGAIAIVSNTGIMVGCGNAAFAPERLLTWGELITVFSRFVEEDEEPPAEIYTGDHWAKDSINTAIDLGWIEYTEAFDPGGHVTCGEIINLIQTVFQWASE